MVTDECVWWQAGYKELFQFMIKLLRIPNKPYLNNFLSNFSYGCILFYFLDCKKKECSLMLLSWNALNLSYDLSVTSNLILQKAILPPCFWFWFTTCISMEQVPTHCDNKVSLVSTSSHKRTSHALCIRGNVNNVELYSHKFSFQICAEYHPFKPF